MQVAALRHLVEELLELDVVAADRLEALHRRGLGIAGPRNRPRRCTERDYADRGDSGRQQARRADEAEPRHDQRTRVPGGGGVSNDTTVGLPPSGLAAKTIPFDSTPISFAGFRLNTTTTVFPISASGS